MAKKPIQVRIDEKLKKQVEEIFEHIGIDVPTAIRMFFKKVAVTGGIPFALKEGVDHFTSEEEEEILKAYKESFDPKNLSRPYENVEDLIRDLHLES